MKTFVNIILYLFLCPSFYIILLMAGDKSEEASNIKKYLLYQALFILVLIAFKNI